MFLVSQSFPFQDWLRSVAKLVFLVCFGSSRCMIAGVPGVPVFPFPGSVEAVGHCKAGVTGTFFLIQVHDRRCSWCLQSFPFHDWLRSVAMAKPVFLVCSSSSRCMIAIFSPVTAFLVLNGLYSQLYFTLSIWLEIPFLYFLISGYFTLSIWLEIPFLYFLISG